jgi:hypothetical protein
MIALEWSPLFPTAMRQPIPSALALYLTQPTHVKLTTAASNFVSSKSYTKQILPYQLKFSSGAPVSAAKEAPKILQKET